MNRAHWITEAQRLSAQFPTLRLDSRALKSPIAYVEPWRIAFEHGKAFKTVALEWRGLGDSPPRVPNGWKRCPPSERRRGWDFRVSLSEEGLSSLLSTLTAIEFEKSSSLEDDEVGLTYEGAHILRIHKGIERRPALAAQAKREHGFVCQACGLDFAKRYGALGKRYIEAHHLTPLASLKGQQVAVNPKVDFAVLCANCHRMIHRSKFIGSVEKFRNAHVKLQDG